MVAVLAVVAVAAALFITGIYSEHAPANRLSPLGFLEFLRRPSRHSGGPGHTGARVGGSFAAGESRLAESLF